MQSCCFGINKLCIYVRFGTPLPQYRVHRLSTNTVHHRSTPGDKREHGRGCKRREGAMRAIARLHLPGDKRRQVASGVGV